MIAHCAANRSQQIVCRHNFRRSGSVAFREGQLAKVSDSAVFLGLPFLLKSGSLISNSFGCVLVAHSSWILAVLILVMIDDFSVVAVADS